MPDEQKKEETKQEFKPENDLIEDLFPEKKEETPKTETATTKKEETKQEKSGDTKPEVNVDEIVNAAVNRAVETIKPMIGEQGSETARKRELDNWFMTEDGRMFAPYRDAIERVALDKRFSGLKVSQLPGAILKPTAYARVLEEAKTKANNNAKDSKTGGDTARGHETGNEETPDYKNMSREDFKKLQEENLQKMREQRK